MGTFGSLSFRISKGQMLLKARSQKHLTMSFPASEFWVHLAFAFQKLVMHPVVAFALLAFGMQKLSEAQTNIAF